jgi:lipopolysaccharide transport system ATP-binding protein
VNTVVRAVGVGKRYRSYAADRPRTLKEALSRGFRTMKGEPFWAVRDVSFEIQPGRTVGLIGANGAGKSTLLRMLAGVERADEGTIEVHGRIGALLELGASFHPEMTGRENVILSSVVAGLTRREARARLSEIVSFAQLEEFIDSPLRTYSTGMATRLAFSIASHIDPDVLLIDEALAVGDISFQQRCIDRMLEFRKAGVTILLVSHDPNRIRDLCDEVLWIRGGGLVAQGPPMEITARYVASQADATKESTPHDVPVAYTLGGVPLRVHENRFGSMEAAITAVRIRDAWDEPAAQVLSGAPVIIEIDVDIPDAAGASFVGATVRRSDELVCLDTYTPVDAGTGRARVRLEIQRLDLAAGEYLLDVGIYSADWSRTFDYHFGAYPLTILGPEPGAGMMAPPMSWRVETSRVAR